MQECHITPFTWGILLKNILRVVVEAYKEDLN